MRQTIIKAGICLFALMLIFGIVILENREALLDKKMEISVTAGEQVINAWEQDGIYYIFLPSYAEMEEVYLTPYSAEFIVKESNTFIEQGGNAGTASHRLQDFLHK